jgi:uracil-DNA glycosylase
MNAQHYFPFGQEVKTVMQTNITPKEVFVLGVYASAVHAQWMDKDGKVLIKAVAVASEPYIFWKGDSAATIIDKIAIAKELGRLIPADSTYNGPSGKSLDNDFLFPLGYKREDAWLCDLVPYSCQNSNQKTALERAYDQYVVQGKFPKYNVSEVPKRVSEERIQEILAELTKAQAKTIILLGDQPIKYFLSRYAKYQKLADFEEYGKPIEVVIEDKTYKVIALAHPRQVNKLGKSNHKWYELHQNWLKNQG